MKEALTFDDVLLVPQKSSTPPDKTNTAISLTKKIKLEIPLISAAMDTVTESRLAIALAKAGGMGIIHKNMTASQQASEVAKVAKKNLVCGASVSVGTESLKRASALAKAGAKAIVVDVAHGHFYKVANTVKALKRLIGKQVVIIGGNVGTVQATTDLIRAGADVVKVGVGPGSICTTRIVAGIGVPQLTAIMDAVKAAKKSKTPIIADGGIKYSGDIVKALGAGASAFMVGSLLAGTDESPGKIVVVKGKKFKTYRGMGSIDAMSKGSKDRYLQAGKKSAEMIAEGVSGQVPYKGTVADVVHQLIGGLRQGMGYTGAKDIGQLHKKASFIKITSASLKESHPHDLANIQNSPNYQHLPK